MHMLGLCLPGSKDNASHILSRNSVSKNGYQSLHRLCTLSARSETLCSENMAHCVRSCWIVEIKHPTFWQRWKLSWNEEAEFGLSFVRMGFIEVGRKICECFNPIKNTFTFPPIWGNEVAVFFQSHWVFVFFAPCFFLRKCILLQVPSTGKSEWFGVNRIFVVVVVLLQINK